MSSLPAMDESPVSFDPTTARRWRAFGLTLLAVFSAGAIACGVEILADQPKPSRKNTARTTAVAAEFERDRPTADLTEQIRGARILTAAARRRADAAENAVFEFLNAKVEEPTPGDAQLPRPATTAPAAVVAPPVVAPVTKKAEALLDPKWLELNRRLHDLTGQRDALLERLTPAHPMIRALQGQIDELQARLAATPPLLPSGPEQQGVAPSDTETAPFQMLPTAQSPIETPRSESRSEVATTEEHGQDPAPVTTAAWHATYRRLLKAAGRARDDYEAALAHETACWIGLQEAIAAAPTINPAAKSTILEPLESEQAVAMPWRALGVLALLSVAAGLFAAALIRRPSPMFGTTAAAESLLRLPILGRLAEQDTAGQIGNAA